MIALEQNRDTVFASFCVGQTSVIPRLLHLRMKQATRRTLQKRWTLVSRYSEGTRVGVIERKILLGFSHFSE